MKKLLSILLCVLTIFSFTINAAAALPEDSGIEPLVYTACSGGNGICRLRSSGWGAIHDANTREAILDWGCCWQCLNCGNVMVTEGDPLLGQSIGTYATIASIDPPSPYLTTIYVLPSRVKYTSATSIEGYRFMRY